MNGRNEGPRHLIDAPQGLRSQGFRRERAPPLALVFFIDHVRNTLSNADSRSPLSDNWFTSQRSGMVTRFPERFAGRAQVDTFPENEGFWDKS